MIAFQSALLSKQAQTKDGYRRAIFRKGALSDDSDTENEKVRKVEKSRKLALEKWSRNSICKV